MRVIRFRGKRLTDGRWVYGDLKSGSQKENFAIHTYDMNGWYNRGYMVDPTTIGQFTGLTDRNGEEIYEGDILAIEGIKYPRHYIVSWNTEKLMFCIGDTPLYALLEAGNTTMREYIVCGNIHDNVPERLKGGEQ